MGRQRSSRGTRLVQKVDMKVLKYTIFYWNREVYNLQVEVLRKD